MNWRVAEAKQKLSAVLRAAEEEPQRIYNRDRLVAAVVAADEFEEFIAWREEQARASLGDAFRELRRLCAEESYTLELPPRQDRPNAFLDPVDDIPV